jgi:muramoyltetrapeptide carboxypeptidase
MSSPAVFAKPPAVRPGDLVAIIAPSGPFDRESFETGLTTLEQRYRLQYDARLFERYRYLAGEDSRRLGELLNALQDPEVKAVFCARGGYGTMRLLPQLAAALKPVGAGLDTALGSSLKPVVGFSDITALHLWLQSRGMASIHGPVVTQLGRQTEATRGRLFALLESTSAAPPLTGTDTYVGGSVEGPLVGGNLSVLSRLLGTPFLPRLEGAVLLLEDLGERPYRLDRMWTHLALAAVFRKVRGIVLGSFSGCEEREADYTSTDVLRALAEETGLPCAAGFPIGHGDINEAVPLGVRVRLDANAKRLSFLEAATGGLSPQAPKAVRDASFGA